MKFLQLRIWLLITLGLVSCAPLSPHIDTPEENAAETSDTVLTQPEQMPIEDDQLVQMQGQMLPITAEVELGGQMIALEVAQTRQQQTIGLMHRDALADDRGMLFPFEPPRPVSFWMKNVQISLDMVFVYQGAVIEITSDVPPCVADPCPTYGPGRQIVDTVIELRGGLAEELGLQVGDPVEVQWLEPSPDTSS
ncbi:MAG: DUF192 domain-containing protein [Leptolyngbya sp. SIO1E4]|nr:DUF192 domain-containing protein [Leptolyngbya sp. SIO1E4]